MDPLYVIVLAAGSGKRMQSKLHKVLHPLCGLAMIDHVLQKAWSLSPTKVFVVVGHDADEVQAHIKARSHQTPQFVLQEELGGTGHAVLQVRPYLKNASGNVLILNGDNPLITEDTLTKLLEVHKRKRSAMTLLTSFLENPAGYGRILRDEHGFVISIVEDSDASSEDKLIQEINTGTYVFKTSDLFNELPHLNKNNQQGEYYLPEILQLLLKKQRKISVFQLAESWESLGVNDRSQLAFAHSVLQRQIINRHLINGVTMLDPSRTYIESDVIIGKDTVIEPDVFLRGKTVIGENCFLGPNVDITNCHLGEGNKITFSVLDQVNIASGVSIGPFAQLRPGTILAHDVKVGSFVDLKNAQIGEKSKVPHLSYLGDSLVGKGVNIGCGAVTVNYNGRKKCETHIDDHAFVGCNVNLVAPVDIGRASYVAAGSTITNNVPDYSLAVARKRQVIKEGYAKKWLMDELK